MLMESWHLPWQGSHPQCTQEHLIWHPAQPPDPSSLPVWTLLNSTESSGSWIVPTHMGHLHFALGSSSGTVSIWKKNQWMKALSLPFYFSKEWVLKKEIGKNIKFIKSAQKSSICHAEAAFSVLKHIPYTSALWYLQVSQWVLLSGLAAAMLLFHAWKCGLSLC